MSNDIKYIILDKRNPKRLLLHHPTYLKLKKSGNDLSVYCTSLGHFALNESGNNYETFPDRTTVQFFVKKQGEDTCWLMAEVNLHDLRDSYCERLISQQAESIHAILAKGATNISAS